MTVFRLQLACEQAHVGAQARAALLRARNRAAKPRDDFLGTSLPDSLLFIIIFLLYNEPAPT